MRRLFQVGDHHLDIVLVFVTEGTAGEFILTLVSVCPSIFDHFFGGKNIGLNSR